MTTLRKITLWLLPIIAIVLAGCSENDESIVYTQRLFIRFENAAGENLVENLEWATVDYPGQNGSSTEKMLVLPTNYTMTVSGKDIHAVANADVLACTRLADGLFLDFTFENLDNTVPTVTWQLTCERIFGDKRAHTIVANYAVPSGTTLECTTLTLDGTACTVTSGAKATIRL